MDTLDDASWDAVFAYWDRKERYTQLQKLCKKHTYLFVDAENLFRQVQTQELQELYSQLKTYDTAYTTLASFGTLEKDTFLPGVLSSTTGTLGKGIHILRSPSRALKNSLEKHLEPTTAKKIQTGLEVLALTVGAAVTGTFFGKKALVGYATTTATFGAAKIHGTYVEKSLKKMQEAKLAIVAIQKRYLN
jgi:hypothetical protein